MLRDDLCQKPMTIFTMFIRLLTLPHG